MLKKYFTFCCIGTLVLLLAAINSCAPTSSTVKNGSPEDSYRYKAISLLENIFYNYENQNFGELKKLFGNKLEEKFSITQDAIRDEFKKFDLIKITFTIDKVEKVNGLLVVHFEWSKNRRDMNSGAFANQGEKKGKSIFTFDIDSGKIKQLTGDYIFGLGNS